MIAEMFGTAATDTEEVGVKIEHKVMEAVDIKESADSSDLSPQVVDRLRKIRDGI